MKHLAISVVIAVSIATAPNAGADEPVILSAPYELASICYKVPGIMYVSYCPPEKFEPASTGVLLAGGGKYFPGPPAYLPYVESMSAGGTFLATQGGTLTVVAELVGVQAGITPSSQVCLLFAQARKCSLQGATTVLTDSTSVSYMENITVQVQARTSQLGVAAATVKSITISLVPTDVVY